MSRQPRLMIVLGALSGAAGVILSALGAHRSGAPQVGTAANMLLFHAPVFLALAALQGQEMLERRAMMIVVTLLAFGLALFCGDLLFRASMGDRLFPFAAPIGGGSIIIGWLALLVSGLMMKKR